MYAVVNLQFNWSDPDQNKSSTINSCFSVFHQDMVHAQSIAERMKEAYEIIIPEERDQYRAVLSTFYILKCIITCWHRTRCRYSQTVNGFCWYIVTNKVTLWSTTYSASVVYTKTIIHLSVRECGGYLPPLW